MPLNHFGFGKNEGATPGSSSLLEPEFEPHFKAWKANPGPKTMTPLLKAVTPVIDSALRTYGGKSQSPVLRTRAQLIAADAIQKYDPSRAKLRTHLMTNLQGLHRISSQQQQIIGIPERIGLDSHKLYLAENELKDQLGRSPSTGELADHTGLSTKRISKIRQASPAVAEGSMQSMGEPGEEQANVGPGIVSPDSDRVWKDFVYGDLHPTDQLIMEHTLGLHGQPMLPKKDIANKLGISAGAVSQRAARIQEMLDKHEELGSFF